MILGNFGTLALSASPLIPNWTPGQEPTLLSGLSDASTPGQIDLLSDHEPTTEAATQSSRTEPFPTTTVPPSQAEPKYCCTLCDEFKPFKNQSDWKKHEKEHDTTYICMVRGPREATRYGAQCAFCGILNPDDGHLLEHNAQACGEGPPKSFSHKRRYEMVSHLSEIHGVRLKSEGEAIAVKWKYTVEKHAWSCGFCVKSFVTFNERLNHIATQHFERGQTINDWDATKVIQGLLQQSEMIKAWEDILESLDPYMTSDIIWETDAIKALQHELEVGPSDQKSAVVLAEAAYTACRLNWGM